MTNPYVPASMTRLAVAFALVLALIVALPGAAHARSTCPNPKYPGSGYFTSLKVTKVSCATGKKVAVAYYKCRLKHGVSGRCTSRVLGYSCKETRTSIPTEIDARVTCKDGSKKVEHSYQQNT
jgi:hypothetical protein